MRKYVLKRVILAFVTAFIILSVTFMLVKLLPFQAPVGQASDYFRFYQDQVTQGYVLRFSEPMEGYGELLWTSAGTNLFDSNNTLLGYLMFLQSGSGVHQLQFKLVLTQWQSLVQDYLLLF